MRAKHTIHRTNSGSNRVQGFSLIELVITIVILLVMAGIALPAFVKFYRTYQLNDGANQVADALKFTRFEAIRRNLPVRCQVRQTTGTPLTSRLWADSNSDGVMQSTEYQKLLTGPVNLVTQSSGPNFTGLAAATGVPVLTPVNLSSGSIQFDGRGALTAPAAYVLYVANVNVRSAGYRAVILYPSGAVETWMSDSSGTWKLLG